MVVGHQHVFDSLAMMSNVVLFTGPPSVGKWTTAEEIATFMTGNYGAEILRVPKLTVEKAKDILDFANITPSHNFRIIIIRMDDASTPAIQMLLDTLEGANRRVVFILVSSAQVPEPVESRCEVYRFDLLTDEQVEEIMKSRGFGEDQSKKLASKSHGSVKRALAALNDGEAKTHILALLQSFRTRSPEALEKLADVWTEEDTQMVLVWASEILTGRWGVFNAEEAGDFKKSFVMQILVALNQEVRPRLIVRSSLMQIMQGA